MAATDISGVAPYDHPYYFFDANAWIAALKNTRSKPLDEHEKPYVTLFEAVVLTNNETDEKLLKKMKYPKPKLIMTSVLLSEIINAYMRNIAMKAYCSFHKIDLNKYDFKKDYRKDPDYKLQLKKLVDDITGFADYCLFIDDGFNALKPLDMLKVMTNKYDFNDFFYYNFCKANNYPIVTHDRDFTFKDITVITGNGRLLK